MMHEEPDTPCSECGAMVHWLDRFPKNRCLPCHAKAVEGESLEEMHQQIVNTFGK
jgi:hypothetical protein